MEGQLAGSRTVQSTPLHSLLSRSNGILQLRTNSWSVKAAPEPGRGEATSTWAAGVAVDFLHDILKYELSQRTIKQQLI